MVVFDRRALRFFWFAEAVFPALSAFFDLTVRPTLRDTEPFGIVGALSRAGFSGIVGALRGFAFGLVVGLDFGRLFGRVLGPVDRDGRAIGRLELAGLLAGFAAGFAAGVAFAAGFTILYFLNPLRKDVFPLSAAARARSASFPVTVSPLFV
jgi:hypothetical protein